MLKMNYWTDKWDLHVDVCPCDVHFNDWVKHKKLKNKLIYHFGTGTHHVVGIKQADATSPATPCSRSPRRRRNTRPTSSW